MKNNFAKETDNYLSNISDSDGVPTYTLNQKRENINNMEAKAKNIQKKLPIIHELEVQLGLPDDVQDPELTAIQTSLDQQITKAKAAIREQAIAEQKEKDAKEPKKEEPITPVNE